MHNNNSLNQFLNQHQLDQQYLQSAEQWFNPLAEHIAKLANSHKSEKQHALTIGISGCQGSGKSTLADYLKTLLESSFQLSVVVLSLDDFYRTKLERLTLSRDVHPLLATRGVPGTHDIELALNCISSLMRGDATEIPRFDKSQDDRRPSRDFYDEAANIIIFEGWCLGARPALLDSLKIAINRLEQEQDGDGAWRQYINLQLEHDYQKLFSSFDYQILLRPPNFSVVAQWRNEQEEKLRQSLEQQNLSTVNLMSANDIDHFIQYYQRITESILTNTEEGMNEHSFDLIFQLNEQRQITLKRQTPF